MTSNIFSLIKGRRGSAISLDTFLSPIQSITSPLRKSVLAYAQKDADADASHDAVALAQAHARDHEVVEEEHDAFLPLTRADTYRAHGALLHSSDDIGEMAEPGLYAKFPRVTAIMQKKDALTKMNIYQFKSYMTNRNKTNDTRPLWVDIQGMDQESLEHVFADTPISQNFLLHPLTLEDCSVSDTLEKIETRNGYYYLVFNDYSKHPDNDVAHFVNLNILVFNDIIITIHPKPCHSIYAVIPKLEFVEGGRIPSIEFVLYLILSRVLDYYDAYISKLDTEAENLDEMVVKLARVNHKLSSELLGRINNATKQISSLLNGLSSKREIFTQLLRSKNIFSSTGLRYIKNTFDHLLKMHLKLSLARDSLNDTNTLYMSKISVELSLLSNEVGIHMRRFGVIGTVFLPLNLIAGIFGMNVLVPGSAEEGKSHFDAFIVLMAIMTVITAAQLGIFYYLKWL